MCFNRMKRPTDSLQTIHIFRKPAKMISLDVFTDICRERYKLHLRCLTGFEIRFCYQKYYFLQSIFKNKTNYFLQPLPVYLLKHKSILNLSDCIDTVFLIYVSKRFTDGLKTAKCRGVARIFLKGGKKFLKTLVTMLGQKGSIWGFYFSSI